MVEPAGTPRKCSNITDMKMQKMLVERHSMWIENMVALDAVGEDVEDGKLRIRTLTQALLWTPEDGIS